MAPESDRDGRRGLPMSAGWEPYDRPNDSGQRPNDRPTFGW